VVSRKARGLSVGLLLLALTCLTAGSAAAANPQDDVRSANAQVQHALSAARQGDTATARQAYADYENTWFEIEDGVRGASRDSYVGIEKAMNGVTAALAPAQADPNQVAAALTALDQQQQAFIASAGANSGAPQTTTSSGTSIGTLVAQLDDAQAALARGDSAAASADLKSFERSWPDVEGQVKTRSADDYRQTETDMALAETLASQSSPEAAPVVARMSARLQPYLQEQRYGIFDASIILLREGLEALLVVVALSAVLKRSGAPGGQAWLWAGAGAGLLLSVVLGLTIQAFFGAVITPTNRELLEGVVGLVAAAMLIYVSYWLHAKASLGGWQKYINQQTAQALEGGRLFGIAFLAFLAVFREGAETALFYFGMASSISNSDLLIGLAIGFALLAALGFAMVVLGVRVPMRPFFAIASVLVFYLCFKFIGTGIHSLQVAGIIPSVGVSYLPSIDLLGVYPTWQTSLVQVGLLILAVAFLLRERLLRSRNTAVIVTGGLLLAAIAACSAVPSRVAPPIAASTPVLPATPVLSSDRVEAKLVAAPRRRLEDLAAALQRNDLAGAQAALDAYDSEWNGIEVYVNFRSRDLYGEIETHYQSDIAAALQSPDPQAKQILPMVQAMVAQYDEAIKLSDSGPPLSPLFDDLATVRIARAPLREVGPALQAGETTRAAQRFAEFKRRWPSAEPLLSTDAVQGITQALEAADAPMTADSIDPVVAGPAVDSLLARYNSAVNVLNTAARNAN
jgi:high-affinity iron transporter